MILLKNDNLKTAQRKHAHSTHSVLKTLKKIDTCNTWCKNPLIDAFHRLYTEESGSGAD